MDGAVLFLLGALGVSCVSTGIQVRPSNRMGIIDLLIGSVDYREIPDAVIFVFGVPFIAGFLLNRLDVSPAIAAGATGLGAFLRVSTAFTHPSLLAPPLQARLKQTRLVYGFMVVTYIVAGAAGAFTQHLFIQAEPTSSLDYQITMGLVVNIVWVTAVYLLKSCIGRWYVSNQRLPSIDDQARQIVRYEMQRVAESLAPDVSRMISEDDSLVEDRILGDIRTQLREIRYLVSEFTRAKEEAAAAGKPVRELYHLPGSLRWTVHGHLPGYIGRAYPRYFS